MGKLIVVKGRITAGIVLLVLLPMTVPLAAAETAPSSPLDLVAQGMNGAAIVGWDAPTSDGGSAITAYKVYRSSSPSGPWSLVATLGSSTLIFRQIATNGAAVSYQVTAVNVFGESAPSNVGTDTPTPEAARFKDVTGRSKAFAETHDTGGFHFEPTLMRASAGVEVRWYNPSFVTHTATEGLLLIATGFNTGIISPGTASSAVTLASNAKYFCNVANHQFLGMHGVIATA